MMTTTTCLHDFFPFFVRNLFLRLKAKEQSLQSCALESHCEVFVFNRGIDTLDPSVMKRMPVDLIARWGPCIVLSSERAALCRFGCLRMVSVGEIVESQVLFSLSGTGLGGKVAGSNRHFPREFPCISAEIWS